MGSLIGLIAFVVIILAALVTWYLVTRPQKTPKGELRDLPEYREKVAFIQKVASYNLTSDGWINGKSVPSELSEEARSILDKERKEMRLR